MRKLKLLLITIVSCITLVSSSINIFAEDGCYTCEDGPDIVSEYVYLINADTKQVLIDEGAQDQIYPASMTKMMTLIVAIENIPDTSKTITIDEEIMGTLKADHASRAGFDVGDEVSIYDLMYGVILPSGAECSRALALEVAGSIEAYVEMMNQKAAELGMNSTHYVNTTGLHDDNHYSTLYDTSILLEYCIQNPLFYEIFTARTHRAEPSVNYPQGLKMDSIVMKYINNDEDPDVSVWIDGFIGGKSGYTIEARYCLASLAERNGIKYMLITAYAYSYTGVSWNIVDAANIYNYYFDNYSMQKLLNANDELLNVPVKYSSFGSDIKFYANEDVELIMPNDQNNIHYVYDIPDELEAPIKKGDVLGTMNIYAYDKLVYSQELIADKSYSYSGLVKFLGEVSSFMKDHVVLLVAILLIIIILQQIYMVVFTKRKYRIKKKSQ